MVPWLGAIFAGGLVLLVFLLPPASSRTATVGGEGGSNKTPDAGTNSPTPLADTVEPRFRLASDTEAWTCLPATASGSQAPLPAWARALAKSLPRTTAAMLELDHLHRSRSPLDPELRGQVRWVAARASHCDYAQAYALADLRSAGLGKCADELLTDGIAAVPSDRRALLEFVHKLAVPPQTLTDDEVKHLIDAHGEKQVVAVVLLVAYAQFLDRLLLALGVSVEPGGPLPALGVRFSRQPLGIATVPPSRPKPPQPPSGSAPPTAAPTLDAEAIRCSLDKQRSRRPRIRLPEDDPGANRWGLVGQTYQPELANAWSTCTQAFGEEANQDPVFEQSLFWLITGSKGCFY
jgi:alkylhydroperoxidase family enzyme